MSPGSHLDVVSSLDLHRIDEGQELLYLSGRHDRSKQSNKKQQRRRKNDLVEREGTSRMNKSLRVSVFLLASGLALGQGQDIDLGNPIYWDANTEPDMDTYGVYRPDTPCTDPTPTIFRCTSFYTVTSVPPRPGPGPWT